MSKDDKCRECVLSVPVNDKIGSFRDGDRYYFMIDGKQRMCRPVERSIRKCQRTQQ